MRAASGPGAATGAAALRAGPRRQPRPPGRWVARPQLVPLV